MPPPAAIPSPAPRSVRAGGVFAALIALFAIDDLLLIRFLGPAPPLWMCAGIGAGASIAIAAYRSMSVPIPRQRIMLCIAIATVLVLLGGEGRLFYANPDWQVRDAVLADMVRLPWPFVYAGHGEPLLLRAPIGMYLLPALIGKLCGQAAAAAALAIQNAAALAAVLGLGSLLAEGERERRMLAAVAIGFGGLDTLGAAWIRPERLWPLTRNIENWGPTILPSPLSSLFWTPQHAIVGFAGAVLVLCWRTGRAPLWALLAFVPLAVLWSPLGALGTLPFAALAGIETLIARRFRPADLIWPALAIIPALVPLVYLSADAARVGARWTPIPVAAYLVFEALEIGPFLLGAAMLARGGRYGVATIAPVAAMLALSPLVGIGESVDFTMRASIPALATLSVLVADALGRTRSSGWRTMLVVVLAVGALAPARDVARAIVFRPSPPPRCDFWRAWDQGFAGFGKETYLARLSRTPAGIRPAAPFSAPPLAPARCWSRSWAAPRF